LEAVPLRLFPFGGGIYHILHFSFVDEVYQVYIFFAYFVAYFCFYAMLFKEFRCPFRSPYSKTYITKSFRKSYSFGFVFVRNREENRVLPLSHDVSVE